MLRKLDWYILKKFFTTFIFAILLLTFITVIIDVSEKADDFVKSGLSASQIIMEYYIGFIPHIVSMLFPLFVFISVVFFTSKMAGRSEIVAILASGISFNRFLRPYAVGAIIMAILLWLSYRYVTPNANKLRSEFQIKYIDGKGGGGSGSSTIYFRNDSTHFGQISYFDTASKRGSGFVFQEIKNSLVKNTRAEVITYIPEKDIYKIEDVLVRTIDSATNKERLVKLDSQLIKLNFKPSEFKKDRYTKDILTTPELVDLIDKETTRGAEGLNEFKVEKYHRDSTPFSLLILTLIGVSLASRKVRGGSGLHIAIGILLAALFILTDRFASIFSTKGNFPPALAAWTPNIIFAFVAIYLFKKAPK
ncbi:LptF/LptG family permease [Polluticaenibacter yanchengensis]|uniref:LptF/LptG family permease n=1 Tax=Polluticaenibacter yanchengensis TaxID=3014562 RepID=A0ABT4UHC2_9BACT|nr:LptF/LptG family permease [Chitinophagaceae bacterium LY-5]